MPRRFPFPPSYRITRDREFQEILTRGKVLTLQHFWVYALGTGRDFPRLGIRVPAKPFSAIARNRVKRWIREAFRLNAPELSGYDLVIRVNPHSPPRSFQEVAAAFQRLRHLLTQPPE